MIRHDLNDAEDSSLVEIADEAFGLLGDWQVIAPWEHMRYAMILLIKAIEPEILTEAHFGDKLTILREMIVKMPWLQVFWRAFQIPDIEPNMEVSLVRFVLRHLIPV